MRRRQIFAEKAKAAPPPEPTRAEWAKKYGEIFGKPPHGRMKLETIKAKINDAGN